MRATHVVSNQAPPLIDYDAADYAPILEALHREGADGGIAGVRRRWRRRPAGRKQQRGDQHRESAAPCRSRVTAGGAQS